MSAIKVHGSHDYVEMDVADQLVFGQNMYDLMFVLLVLFPHVPNGGMGTLDTANGDLDLKIKAYKVNPLKYGELVTSRQTWIEVVTAIVFYVDSIAGGVASIYTQAGIHTTKDTKDPAHQPAVPVIASAESKIVGGLDMEVKPQKDANAFAAIMYTSDLTPVYNGNQVTFTIVHDSITSQVAIVISKQRKMSFRGLLSFVRMKLVALALNAWGASNPTAPTDKGIL